jgi:hypothetical protein
MSSSGNHTHTSDDLFAIVKRLGLPQRDYAIFGSGPLIVREIIPFTNDLDIICRKKAWEIVLAKGQSRFLQEYDTTIVSMEHDAINFGTAWGIGHFDMDALIDTADIIGGLPFVQIQYVIKYKTIRGLPKDLSHIEAARRAGLLK